MNRRTSPAIFMSLLISLLFPLADVQAAPNDKDGDGYDQSSDNCPNDYNPTQLDTDVDGKGDACDTDDDNDGLSDADELSNGSNPLVTDTDNDGLSDLADPAPIDKLGVMHEINGDGAGEKWATALASGGDFDGDGLDDVLVGTPYDKVYVDVNGKQVGLFHAGTVRVFSSATGQEITASRISGTLANQRVGAAIAVVPDQNSDGQVDIAVGEPLANVVTDVNGKQVTLKAAGKVSLYSGADGSWIKVIADGKKAGDRFGAALAVGNLDNSGSLDLVVGAPMADVTTVINSKNVVLANAGSVTAFNGISNIELYSPRNGAQANARFGSALAVDGDTLLVGEPLYDVQTVVNSKNVVLANAGRVQMFDASNGDSPAVGTPLNGETSNDWLGSSLAALSADINNDGFSDWLVGVPRANITIYRTKPLVKADAGKVMLMSGQNKTAVLTLTGTMATDRLGTAVCAGQFNDDGATDVADFALGSTQFDVPTIVNTKTVKLSNAGRAMLYSGAALLP